MQSRRMSVIESVANIAVGIGVAYIMNFWILSMIGNPISHRQNMLMTAFMTAVSFARSYALRRFFNSIKA
jgi:hypothetical protein